MFNSNNAFVVEIVLRISGEENGSWSQLMDRTSGSLGKVVRKVIEPKYGPAIPDLFSDLVNDRNRIGDSCAKASMCLISTAQTLKTLLISSVLGRIWEESAPKRWILAVSAAKSRS